MFNLQSLVIPTILCIVIGVAISYGRTDTYSSNLIENSEDDTKICEKSPVKCKLWLPDPNLDLEWLRSQDFWYLPLWDIHIAQKFLSLWGIGINFADSEELSRNLCPYFTSLRHENKTGFYALGDSTFLPKKIFFNPYRPGVFEIIINEKQVGTAYNSFTDNKSFVISNAEFNTGERHVFVMSKTPTLPQEVVPMIEDKLVDLGFGDTPFIRMHYDNCPAHPLRV